MANHWNLEGIPDKGWVLQAVYDVRGGGETEEEAHYETCMMCNNERIRYVHVVTHPGVEKDFKVGCICAEKMTGDYVNPKEREKDLKSRAGKRIQWLKKEWHINQNGNYYLMFEEHYLLVYRDKQTGKFKCRIGEVFGQKAFDTLEQAKNAVFTGIDFLKERAHW